MDIESRKRVLTDYEKIVRYYYVKKGRNQGIVVVYSDWPKRSIEHNGWGLPLAVRRMTEDEIAYEETCARYHFDSYSSIEALLTDEQKILANDEYVKLYNDLTKHFEIDQSKIGRKRPKQLKLFELEQCQIPHS